MTRPAVIGLTGSIGMGKSTVAAQFAALGAKICNADRLVHILIAPGGEAVTDVATHFPTAVKNGVVDRKILGGIVFADKEKRGLLESILHPRVMAMEEAFIEDMGRLGARLVVLDIPLLFETGGEERCDMTVVVSAPYTVQRRRVLARPGMTEEKFARILSTQMPDGQKRLLADMVVHTGLGRAYSFREIVPIVKDIYEA